MKKFLAFMLFFGSLNLWAQNEGQALTITFSEMSLQEVFQQIQNKTGQTFFYVEEWIPARKISGNYTNVDLPELMQDVLGGTNLNYYILDDWVVITKNSIIYDELPEGFFGRKDVETVQLPEEGKRENKVYNPVFYPEEEISENKEIETVYIGKAERTAGQVRFKLSGIVTSAENGKPIENLAISVKSKKIGTVTNNSGYYELELPPGVNLVETSSLGNKDVTKRVVIYNDGKLNLTLEEKFEQLGEILLDSDPDSNVSDAITGSEEIEVEAIKNIPLVLGERDIFKVATTLPGISTAGEGAAGFNVRGGRADQNLILLDNAVIYNPVHFFGIFSALNPFTTGKVDIYKGHIPVEFGGRLSSVFDIETKQATQEKFGGEVSVGPVTGNVSLEVPVVKGKSGLLVGARSTYSDWILRSLDEESLKNSEASFYDVIAKYNHRFGEKTKLDLTGYYSKDRFSITSDSLYDYKNRLLSLQLNHRFSDQTEGDLIIINSDYKFNVEYNSLFNNNFVSGYNINETEVKLQMRQKLTKKHRLKYGASGKLYKVKPGEIKPLGEESTINFFEIPQEKGVETAVFLGDEFEVNDKLLINAGLRYSMFAALGEGMEKIYQEGAPRRPSSVVDSTFYSNNEVIESYGGPEVRLSVRYLLQEDLSLKASYNSTYQYIHTLSTNTTTSPTDTYKLSNGLIKPQRADQYSLGLFKNLMNNTYELSLEGYYKTSENILDYKVGAQLFLNEDLETEVLQGKGESYGAEFFLKKTKGALNGWLSYSYSRSFVKMDGRFKEETVNGGDYFPANFDKPHDLSLVANYKFTQRFSLSANFVYQTGRPVTYPVGKYQYNGAEYVMYSDRNKYRIPDYYRLDLSFNVEGNHKIKKFAHSFWNISVYNVLGRNNPYSVYFVTKDGGIKAYKSSIFSIPVPTITYNFKF